MLVDFSKQTRPVNAIRHNLFARRYAPISALRRTYTEQLTTFLIYIFYFMNYNYIFENKFKKINYFNMCNIQTITPIIRNRKNPVLLAP